MRVLLTRPERDAARTAARLAALGHEALVAPVLTVVPTGDAPPADPGDAILVTSRNAVAPLASLAGAWAGCPLFALGERTADELRAIGYGPVTALAGSGQDLAGAVLRALPAGARVLHAAGRDRHAEPAATLARHGMGVVVWSCYAAGAAEMLPPAAAAALAAGTLDVALHYSRRTAETLLGLTAAAELADRLVRLDHLCLSAEVASGLGPLASFARVAAAPDEDALLFLLGPRPERRGLGGT